MDEAIIKVLYHWSHPRRAKTKVSVLQIGKNRLRDVAILTMSIPNVRFMH